MFFARSRPSLPSVLDEKFSSPFVGFFVKKNSFFELISVDFRQFLSVSGESVGKKSQLKFKNCLRVKITSLAADDFYEKKSVPFSRYVHLASLVTPVGPFVCKTINFE